MSVHNNTNSSSSVPSIPFPSPTAEVKQSENSSNLSPYESYADTTYLTIDDQAAERLNKLKREVTASKISVWVGSGRAYLQQRSCRISIRDARLINQNSARTIFEINRNNLLEFKVIDSARKTLQSLSKTSSLKETSRIMNFPHYYLQTIKDGKLSAIPKVNAEKIEEFLETDIFCIQQIFERACEESIEKVRKEEAIDTPAQITLIKFDERTKEKFDHLDVSIKSKIKQMTGTTMYHRKKATSVRYAVLVNKASGLDIYSFSVQNLEVVPFSNETQDQLNTLISLKSKHVDIKDIVKESGIALRTLHTLRTGEQKKIQYDNALKLNTYFGGSLFDFEKILNEAITEADQFYETSLQTTKDAPALQTRKRKNNDNCQLPAKKQKTDPIEEPPTHSRMVNGSSPLRSAFEEQQPLGDIGSDAWPIASFDDGFSESDSISYSLLSPFSPYSTTYFEPEKQCESDDNPLPSPLDAEIDSFFS